MNKYFNGVVLCQGTTLVVPKMMLNHGGLHRLRKNSFGRYAGTLVPV